MAQLNLNQIERFLSDDYAYEKQKSVTEFRQKCNLEKFFYFITLATLQEALI